MQLDFNPAPLLQGFLVPMDAGYFAYASTYILHPKIFIIAA
jgi:hypothetical protein